MRLAGRSRNRAAQVIAVDAWGGPHLRAEIPVETALAAVAGRQHRGLYLLTLRQAGKRVAQANRHDVPVDRLPGGTAEGGGEIRTLAPDKPGDRGGGEL